MKIVKIVLTVQLKLQICRAILEKIVIKPMIHVLMKHFHIYNVDLTKIDFNGASVHECSIGNSCFDQDFIALHLCHNITIMGFYQNHEKALVELYDFEKCGTNNTACQAGFFLSKNNKKQYACCAGYFLSGGTTLYDTMPIWFILSYTIESY